MKKSKMKKKKFALFGCGLEGEKIYYQFMRRGIRFDCIYDNYKTGHFYGNDILRIQEERSMLKDMYILVSSPVYYDEIKSQLEDYGLEEFKDFIIGASYGKKLTVVNGNCHGQIMCHFLNSSRQFRQKYFIYDIKPVFELGEEGLRKDLLQHCDLYIHQDIREDNSCGYRVSDKYARGLLKEGCVDITIPNLFGMGQAFFIQNCNNCYEGVIHDKKNLPFGMFPYGDMIIDRMLKEGEDFEKISSYIKSGKVFEKNAIEENFDKVILKFREREKNWDIKIMDYILDNYKDRKMFYDAKHPTNIVIHQIVRRVLEYIGICGDEIACQVNLGGYEMPIYPEVKDVLGLSYGGTDEMLRVETFCKLTEEMDIDEYIRQYIFWNTGA